MSLSTCAGKRCSTQSRLTPSHYPTFLAVLGQSPTDVWIAMKASFCLILVLLALAYQAEASSLTSLVGVKARVIHMLAENAITAVDRTVGRQARTVAASAFGIDSDDAMKVSLSDSIYP